jgi:uncharacterized RDD family membrane protein YckC
LDVTTLPGWQVLNDDQRRLVVAAAAYPQHGDVNRADLLGVPEFAIVLSSDRRRRLGDIAAKTLVTPA